MLAMMTGKVDGVVDKWEAGTRGVVEDACQVNNKAPALGAIPPPGACSLTTSTNTAPLCATRAGPVAFVCCVLFHFLFR
jgi:hypothetical protein